MLHWLTLDVMDRIIKHHALVNPALLCLHLASVLFWNLAGGYKAPLVFT